MAENTREIEAAVAALADDASAAAFVRSGRAVLALSVPPDRVVWASASASGLRAAMSASDGYLRADIPALDRLRMLAAGLAPRTGVRLEPVRFRPDQPAVDVAFRLVRLKSGEVLVAGIGDEVPPDATAEAPPLDPVRFQPRPDMPAEQVTEDGGSDSPASQHAPAGSTPPHDEPGEPIPHEAIAEPEAAAPIAPEPAEDGPEPPAAETAAEPSRPLDVEPIDRVRREGVRRFIWSADRDGRFTSVSTPLAEVVGEESADIVGRSWSEILDRLVIDEHGAVALCFARRATWSNETVLWRVAGTALVVPVELGGMPVFGRGHELDGYRGFGLCRADDVAPAPDEPPPRMQEIPDEAPRSSASGEISAPRRESRVPASDAESERPVAQMAVETQAGAAPVVPAATDARARVADQHVPPHAFESLQTRIGGYFGTVRPLPLTSFRDRDDRASTAPDSSDDPPAAHAANDKPILSVSEQGALREIARALGAKIGSNDEPAGDATPSAELPQPPRGGQDSDVARVFDRLPIGLMVLQGETPVFVNRFALDCLGFPNLDTLVEEGGASRLFAGRLEPGDSRLADAPAATALVARSGMTVAAEVRLTTVDWGDSPASVVLIRPLPDTAPAAERIVRALEFDLARSEERLQESAAILDLSGVAVATLDQSGRLLSLNGTAEQLFGYPETDLVGESCTALLAPESHRAAIDLIEAARRSGAPGEERAVSGRSRRGEPIPLLARAGRIGGAEEPRLCLLFRDVSAFRRAEVELDDARRAAEDSSARRADFLARVSHEIRTPLNAIIGFAELMIEQRFGAIGNDRYAAYLKDIRDSGVHVVSLVNDLLDLAKVTAGKSDLTFGSVDIGEVAAQSVGMLQPAAARERIVMRASFTPGLPRIVADERSIRQIAINLLANAVRFTGAGGQVIVSTGLTDRGEVALRVRDTGIGMTPDEIQSAMEPFRQVPTAGRQDGTGLGLPLSKALAEANRGSFSIKSTRGRGTLVEIVFAPDRFA